MGRQLGWTRDAVWDAGGNVGRVASVGTRARQLGRAWHRLEHGRVSWDARDAVWDAGDDAGRVASRTYPRRSASVSTGLRFCLRLHAGDGNYANDVIGRAAAGKIVYGRGDALRDGTVSLSLR